MTLPHHCCSINLAAPSSAAGATPLFYVCVRVEAQQFKDAIDVFMSADSWPTGVLVKRFFKPKNGGT